MDHLYSTDKLFSPSFSFEDAHNMLDLSRLILEKNRKKICKLQTQAPED